MAKTNKSQTNNDPSQSKSIIEKGTHIKGNINTDGNVYVNGTLEGNITSTSKVSLGQDGKVIGELKAENAIIEGTFDGKLVIQEQLIIKGTGNVKGDVSTGSIVVDNGAQCNYNITTKGTKQASIA